jgi:hypothetical protein
LKDLGVGHNRLSAADFSKRPATSNWVRRRFVNFRGASFTRNRGRSQYYEFKKGRTTAQTGFGYPRFVFIHSASQPFLTIKRFLRAELFFSPEADFSGCGKRLRNEAGDAP